MSVSLLEVIEAGGYDLTTVEDANWLLSKYSEFNGLVDEAQALIDADAERELEESERMYNEVFGDE